MQRQPELFKQQMLPNYKDQAGEAGGAVSDFPNVTTNVIDAPVGTNTHSTTITAADAGSVGSDVAADLWNNTNTHRLPDYKDQTSAADSMATPSNKTTATSTNHMTQVTMRPSDSSGRTSSRTPSNTTAAAVKSLDRTNDAGLTQKRRLPDYKDQAGSFDDRVDSDRQPVQTQRDRPNIVAESEGEHVDAPHTEAVAELHESRPIVVHSDGVAHTTADFNPDGMPIAVGVGVLVDEIYDTLFETPTTAPASLPDTGVNPDSGTANTSSTSAVIKQSPVESGLFQKYKTFWILLVVAFVVVVASVAGICGSGACRGGNSNDFKDNGGTPDAPVQAPVVVRGNLPYFTSTEELYLVVDDYVNAVYYDNGTDALALQTDLTDQYGAIGDWDVSRLTDFSYVFYRGDRAFVDFSTSSPLETAFNEDISGWNVSAATTMAGMFAGATRFNQNLSSWDTRRVVSMRAMFHSAKSFNGDLSGWNVESVVDFNALFFGCSSFQGSGLSLWDTQSAQDMTAAFFGTTSLSADLSLWIVGQVTSFDSMFYSSGFNGDLVLWNTSNAETMKSMFYNATTFNGDVSTWDTARVTDISYMFNNAETFNSNLPWDVSKVTSMAFTFDRAYEFASDVSMWNTSSCNDMTRMFAGAFAFNSDLSQWNVSSVARMISMFDFSTVFAGNISAWDVSNLKECSFMFRGTTRFNSDITNWNVAKVDVMTSMFRDAKNFNQSLCEWGPRFVNDNVVWTGIFAESSCAVKTEPVDALSGPWCQVCTG